MVCAYLCVQIKPHISSCFLNLEDLAALHTCIPHVVLQEGKLNVLGKGLLLLPQKVFIK